MASTDMEDLHGLVLTQAFSSLLASPRRLSVVTSDHRHLSLTRSVLLLFSPLLRRLLGAVPPGAPDPALLLPGVTAATMMQLEDLLTTGRGGAGSPAEVRAVLEAAKLLELPVAALQAGEEGPAARLAMAAASDTVVADTLRREQGRGRGLLLVGCATEQAAPPAEKEPTAAKPKTPAKPAAAPAPVQVKREPVVEEETNAEETNETSETQPQAAAETNQDNAAGDDSEDAKNKCVKCNKGHASLTLLRYHYCSHFRGLLKKRFSSLFNDNKCLVCQKNFANSGRLLLHIGVQHDKINEILRLKGMPVLPPFVSAGEGGHAPTVSKMEPMDTMEPAPAPSPVPNPAPTPTPAPSEAAPKPVPQTATPPLPLNLATPSALNITRVAAPTAPPTAEAATPPPRRPEAPRPDTTPCNYDLACEVCSQKQRTIQLLEQHCCRHFMKELQEQNTALMDGMRCTLCNNVFKQKHSLLLHIGCKHGKVNDILKQKGFAALPCPVNVTNNAAMQKQLIQIKKEKAEEVKDEGREAEQPANSLEAILKKYKFTTGAGDQLSRV